jgi:hypothetical protein
MTDGDYTYVLEAAEDGEQHRFECRDGCYFADDVLQVEAHVKCLMDATLDLLLQQQALLARLGDPDEIETCPSCAPHVHPGSQRSH